MGISLGLLNKLGAPGVNTLAIDNIYDRYFKDPKIETFEQFHIALIDLCKFLNDIMPGKHYDAPTMEKVKKFFEDEWKPKAENERKDLFIEFMQKNVTESKTSDTAVIMAGVAVPAAAVFLKRTGDNIPQVKRFKLHLIPNFIFVPSCTVLALAGVRFAQVSKKSKA